jgi:LmbE family N-acetylglucosaminyl deacetylase
MARAAAEGHRVVLVVATNGDHGERPDDLAEGETLVDRRRDETAASADVLGVARVVWLGYRDSGMSGWTANGHPASFWCADVDEAAERLAAVLREERADLLTIYDWHGTYGHPDHVQVHRVGVRAGALVPGVRVLEATTNRDEMVRMIRDARDAGLSLGNPDTDGDDDFDPEGPADDGNPFGEPEEALTLAVDVRSWVDHKRRAMACHRSQISDSSFFLEMPDEVFAAAFGTEWFIEHDARPPYRWGWVLADPTVAAP